MTVELFHAILNPRGPNYERLKDIFPSRIPLVSSQPTKAQLGEEKDVPCYLLDFRAMPLGQRSQLVATIAKEFGVSIGDVDKTISTVGFPIREADVIVSYDMRAFV